MTITNAPRLVKAHTTEVSNVAAAPLRSTFGARNRTGEYYETAVRRTFDVDAHAIDYEIVDVA